MSNALRVVDIRGDRFYYWDGIRYVSVTTAISTLPKPKLASWKMRKVIEDYRINEDAVKSLTPTAVLEYLDKNDSSTSADTGSRVHGYMEAVVKGLKLDEYDSEIAPYYDHVHRFLDDYKPTIVESEAAVFNEDWRYAGRIDLIVEIGGERYVLDIKTGKRVYSEVGLQLSAYRNADFIGRPDGRKDGFPDCNRKAGLVLHIRPEGYDVRTVDIGSRVFETFLSTLDIFHWSRQEGDDIIGGTLPVRS